MKKSVAAITLIITLANPAASAKEVNEHLAVGVGLFGIYQYGDFTNNLDDDGKPINSQGEGAAGLDLDIHYTPTSDDESMHVCVLLPVTDSMISGTGDWHPFPATWKMM
jgi:hypothetical protein